MRAILLCAGRGSRLLPLTMEHPKCLVPVHGKAILDHQIEALRAAGVDRFTIIGGYRIAEIAAHLESYPAAERPELLANPFWSLTSSIASLWFARERMQGAFCIANGDVVFATDVVRGALDRMRPGMNLLVEQAPGHPDDMRVALDGERIAAVAKTLDPRVALYRSLGILLSPSGGESYRAMVETIVDEDGGPGQFHHEVVNRLCAREPVHAIQIHERWTEIDSPQDIEAWNQAEP